MTFPNVWGRESQLQVMPVPPLLLPRSQGGQSCCLSAHLPILSAELGLSCCADGFFHGPVMLFQSCSHLSGQPEGEWEFQTLQSLTCFGQRWEENQFKLCKGLRGSLGELMGSQGTGESWSSVPWAGSAPCSPNFSPNHPSMAGTAQGDPRHSWAGKEDPPPWAGSSSSLEPADPPCRAQGGSGGRRGGQPQEGLIAGLGFPHPGKQALAFVGKQSTAFM